MRRLWHHDRDVRRRAKPVARLKIVSAVFGQLNDCDVQIWTPSSLILPAAPTRSESVRALSPVNKKWHGFTTIHTSMRSGNQEAQAPARERDRRTDQVDPTSVVKGIHWADTPPSRVNDVLQWYPDHDEAILRHHAGLPNDPSSATRPTRNRNCNRSALVGFVAAHG